MAVPRRVFLVICQQSNLQPIQFCDWHIPAEVPGMPLSVNNEVCYVSA